MTDLLERAPDSAPGRPPEVGSHNVAGHRLGRLVARFAVVGFVVGCLAGGYVAWSALDGRSPAHPVTVTHTVTRTALPQPAIAPAAMTCPTGSVVVRLAAAPVDRYARFDASVKLADVRLRMSSDGVRLPAGASTGYTAVSAGCAGVVTGLDPRTYVVWAGPFTDLGTATSFCTGLGLNPTGRGQWDCLPRQVSG